MLTQSQSLSDVTVFLKVLRAVFAKIGNDHLSSPQLLVCYDSTNSMQVDDLQEMAGKYADTVEENRRLYNEVQDLKGNIRVFCRIRPPGTTGDQNPSCLTAGVEGEVTL